MEIVVSVDVVACGRGLKRLDKVNEVVRNWMLIEKILVSLG